MRQEQQIELTVQSFFSSEQDGSGALQALEEEICRHPAQFFEEQVFARGRPLPSLQPHFSALDLPQQGRDLEQHLAWLREYVFAQSMPTAAPRFVGHMTSALPNYLASLSKILAALNQNVVKLETSHAFTLLERQVLGILHKLVFAKDEAFYARHLHDSESALGAFCAGGTAANLSALWALRNCALGPQGDFAGVAEEGLPAALTHYGYTDLVLLVSARAHYSLRKAADLLGLGKRKLITIATDGEERIRTDLLRQELQRLRAAKVKVLAIVGIAGTTETGAIDPLHELAQIAREYDCPLHVDAAWGGASLLSPRLQALFAGIEQADSVVIDAHKQLYVPMGAGMVLFNNPALVGQISHSANYIIRRGSADLGRHTLEGSRAAMALLLHANLHILGRNGYAGLLERSVDTAHAFADLIRQQEDFELISAPQLCILTYRYLPPGMRRAWGQMSEAERDTAHALCNRINEELQELQREKGQSFVSRTSLTPAHVGHRVSSVLRVVLANPLTQFAHLQAMLEEQRRLLPACASWQQIQDMAIEEPNACIGKSRRCD